MFARTLPWMIALSLVAAPAGARTLGSVAFESCDLRAPRGTARVAAECAAFEVPEDPAAPDGRHITLRLALVPARASRPLPDPVVFLAGGPGQSAIEAFPAVQAALNPLLARRNVLLVEQRGTGESSPLDCPFPDWKVPADGATAAVAARGQAAACLARVEGTADPRHYATANYILDLERVRTALGVTQLNLVGGSYGTRVALEYLRRHPDAIRSVFIDSVVPPGLALGQEHARNLDAALRSISARCSADAACRARFGDFGDTLRALQRKVREAPAMVSFRHPQTHERLRAPFGELALATIARMFAYAPQSAALLPLLVSEAAAGRPEPLLAQTELVYGTIAQDLSHGMELSVICAEDGDRLRSVPDERDLVMGNAIPDLTAAQCAVWPHGTRPAGFNDPVVSDKPVLLLSGEHDPVTPPRYAEEVARALANSRALVARGQGHTPMAVGCMPRLLKQFVDTLDPKALDAGCLDALGETPFFLDFQGPSP